MIIIDSSALIAIMLDEAEGKSFAMAITGDDEPLMSVGNALECFMVLAAKRSDATEYLEVFLYNHRIRLEPITLTQLVFARQAFAQYGKGRHPAGLNFGDCFAYALAKSMDAPLLFKGDDFRKTDIRIAL